MRIIAISILILTSVPTWAQTFVGTFVAVKGDVKILKTPAGATDPGPYALYEGEKYIYEMAKIGKKVKPLEIVQSGADGKAKIVYPNGDNFLIGVGTTMVMPTVHEGGTKKATSLKLIYGRVRALISKTGPRNNMKVSTPTAVAGVRGTDFFTRANPTDGTQVTVLRGEVAMQTTAKPNVTIPIKTGHTAEVDPKTVETPRVVEATKQELMAVQSESSVKANAEDIAALPADIKTEIATLAESSKSAVLNDIKATDENLYNQLAQNNALDAEEINTAVVAELYKTAPMDQKNTPTPSEIDAIGRDVYDKYFKKSGRK